MTLVQGHSYSTSSNFSLEIAGPIEAKFHVEPPWDEGMKGCSNGPGHMTNMAAMPIKNFFSGTLTLKGMQHWVLKYYPICSNDAPGLTLTYFTAMSNVVHYAFVWEKGKTMDFSETTVVYIKVDRCRQPNEYMKLYEYQRSKSFIELGPNLISQIQYF